MFKKNQKAFYLSTWDDKATIRIMPVIVEACGKKQMTLRSEAGEMLGTNFRPQEGQNGAAVVDGRHLNVVISADAFADRAAVEKAALDQAAFFRETQIAHYERCIERNPDAGRAYLDAMARELEAVRAAVPSFVWRGEK